MRFLALFLIALALLADPARADITDSGQLVIGGTATIQGNAFSVGGSTFAVADGSVTLGGRLNTATAGIKWPDGTIQVSSPAAGAAVRIATHTTLQVTDYSWSNTSWSGCNIAGSTITATTTKPNLVIEVVGNMEQSSSAYSTIFVLQDGAFIPPETSSLGFLLMRGGSAPIVPAGLRWKLFDVSPGSHRWCLGGRVQSGTGYFDCTYGCQFTIYESD